MPWVTTIVDQGLAKGTMQTVFLFLYFKSTKTRNALIFQHLFYFCETINYCFNAFALVHLLISCKEGDLAELDFAPKKKRRNFVSDKGNFSIKRKIRRRKRRKKLLI